MRLSPLLCLLPALVLSACAPAPVPTAPDPQLETRGTVTGNNGASYSGGAGTVSLVVDGKTLSSAPISAAGQFTLPLPQAAALVGLGVKANAYPGFNDGCTRDMQVSEGSAELVVVDELQVQATGSTDKKLLSRYTQDFDRPLDASTSTQELLIHASAATQLFGEVSCQDKSKRANYSFLLRLNQGWNTVRLSQSILAGTPTRAVTQFASIPTLVDTSWKTGSLQALSR
jgi:hypothetical protein